MKKILIITGIVIGFILLSFAGYAYYLFKSVQQSVDEEMQVELERDRESEDDVNTNEGNNNTEVNDVLAQTQTETESDERRPLSFLLLGIDAEDGHEGLADSIIVVTVNPEDDSMLMVSLPRDTRLEIPGRDGMDKVNHSYGYGGPDLVVETVENYFGIHLDYFIALNMQGFNDAVDAVGGVEVNNRFSFEQDGYTFEEGNVDLDGERALAYTRMRQEDPRGDLGRNERQRQVVQAIIDEGASFRSVFRIERILEAVETNTRMNLNFDKITDLQQNYAGTRRNLATLELEGDGEVIDGVWYLSVPEEERKRVSRKLQEHLES